MTFEVYVDNFDIKEVEKKLKKITTDFKKVHNVELSKHEICLIRDEKNGFFLAIPCHWSEKHMEETLKDITYAFIKNDIKEFKVEMSW